jgi:hypothetical protein
MSDDAHMKICYIPPQKSRNLKYFLIMKMECICINAWFITGSIVVHLTDHLDQIHEPTFLWSISNKLSTVYKVYFLHSTQSNTFWWGLQHSSLHSTYFGMALVQLCFICFPVLSLTSEQIISLYLCWEMLATYSQCISNFIVLWCPCIQKSAESELHYLSSVSWVLPNVTQYYYQQVPDLYFMFLFFVSLH